MARRYRRGYISRNGLTPKENCALGRQVWALFMLLLIWGSIQIWGPEVFLKPWFDVLIVILSEVAYRLTGWLLRTLHIWHY
ncbi:hypothetical protein KKC44_03705 [Patescibacteria group bacterium]|nr:hypothetical protein [Patescibacteria group bacterium]MBU2259686.1 hypothetical protein [Patescibacteria group bacterium]